MIPEKKKEHIDGLRHFVLALIINPKLFDLKNDMDEQGNPSRKKIIYLALSEWLLYPIAILSLIPLLLVSVK